MRLPASRREPLPDRVNLYIDRIMKKEQTYRDIRFSADAMREAIRIFTDRVDNAGNKIELQRLKLDHGDATWHYDSTEEFLADFRRLSGFASLTLYARGLALEIAQYRDRAEVSVEAPSREVIATVFEVFEKHAPQSKLPPKAKPVPPPVIFIGHGRSMAWRDLKDHLSEKHGFRVETYETGARAGHTIRDILEDMVAKSSFAVLVMTAEDEQQSGQMRARQNVVHEAGLFQGRLGFARAIMLLEEGVEEFSNVQGVQYIRFAKNNIKETFGEVLATLRREFLQ